MSNKSKVIVAILIVAIATTLGIVLYQEISRPPAELTFVVIPAADQTSTELNYEPMRAYLELTLGRPVKLIVAADYTGVVTAMKYGDANIFARFGPESYVVGTEQADIEAIAAGIKKSTGKAAYHALIVTRTDRGVTDLNGVRFAYVDELSTSGYVIPHKYIESAGITLGEVLFAGSHEAVLLAVKNGDVDAGAVADNRYFTALEGTGAEQTGKILDEGELTVFWESDFIPNSPIAVRKDMDSALKESLLQALLNAPLEVIEQMGTGETGFVKMTDADYDVLR